MDRKKIEKNDGVGKPDVNAGSRSDVNEGEGNKSADRQYRSDVKKFVEEHDVDALASAAAREIEGDESFAEAEREGKKHIAEEDPELKR